MLNEDVLDLYPRVPVGTKVTVTWQRFYSQAVASGDEPAPFSPMASLRPPPTRRRALAPIRQRTPSADAERSADTTAMPRRCRSTEAPGRRSREADRAEAGEEGRGAQEARGRHGCRSRLRTHDAVAIAEKAAAAAAKAAEAARAAAEAAKKAAEDAKNATSAQSSEPGKRAAL